jgi:hypothetical protein
MWVPFLLSRFKNFNGLGVMIVREIMSRLLGSTNKAEVLASMEFFRVAWEYQFGSAEVSVFPFHRHIEQLTIVLATARHQEDAPPHLVQR